MESPIMDTRNTETDPLKPASPCMRPIKLCVLLFLIGIVFSVCWMSFSSSAINIDISGVFLSSGKTCSSPTKAPLVFPTGIDDYDPFLREVELRHQEKEKQCPWKNSKDENRIELKCGFESMQTFMDECGFFPDTLTLDNNTTEFGFCNMTQLTEEDERDFFHAHIERILVMGDSNGIRFNGGLIRKIKKLGIDCWPLKTGEIGFIIEHDYFYGTGAISDALQDVSRTCKYCVTVKYRCSVSPTPAHNETKHFYLEFLPLVINMMHLPIVNQTYCKLNPGLGICKSEYVSYIDFVFKYYLRNAYPDVLIISPSFAHDARQPLKLSVPTLPNLTKLIGSTLPRSSHVIWIPCLHLNMLAFPPHNDTDAIALFTGRSNTIRRLNHWLFDVLQATRDEGKPRVHGFIDVGQIARDNEMELAMDMVHCKPRFYESIANMMLNVLPSLYDEK